MARHAQPRELAELKSAMRKHPDRYRKNNPKSRLPLGHPPKHLNEAQAKCWREISNHALDGVLTGADRFILEITATLLAQFREDTDKFPTSKYPHLIGGLARMGYSPADRTKLDISSKDDDNPYDHLDD